MYCTYYIPVFQIHLFLCDSCVLCLLHGGKVLQGTKLPACYKQAYLCEFRGLQHHKFIRDSPVSYMDHDRLRFSSDGTYNIVVP